MHPGALEEKAVLRRRIASMLNGGDGFSPCSNETSGPLKVTITEEQVFLYPTGMSAIWNAHQMSITLFKGLKSVCLGYETLFYEHC
jgi:cystathionine gamma-synthase